MKKLFLIVLCFILVLPGCSGEEGAYNLKKSESGIVLELNKKTVDISSSELAQIEMVMSIYSSAMGDGLSAETRKELSGVIFGDDAELRPADSGEKEKYAQWEQERILKFSVKKDGAFRYVFGVSKDGKLWVEDTSAKTLYISKEACVDRSAVDDIVS